MGQGLYVMSFPAVRSRKRTPLLLRQQRGSCLRKQAVRRLVLNLLGQASRTLRGKPTEFIASFATIPLLYENHRRCENEVLDFQFILIDELFKLIGTALSRNRYTLSAYFSRYVGSKQPNIFDDWRCLIKNQGVRVE